ncbi:uncharacterized protein RAG0_17036 [Rhynchosporium agropyri]|uniref:Uncharacterized protein n=1 Tax=Rhynchosporium agropyri TaxID=914238 RepID=A0A1E1LSR0_9HELO|nr:uncharacterized protein RAG0_17036 [Rhynchosporium agropyri]
MRASTLIPLALLVASVSARYCSAGWIRCTYPSFVSCQAKCPKANSGCGCAETYGTASLGGSGCTTDPNLTGPLNGWTECPWSGNTPPTHQG